MQASWSTAIAREESSLPRATVRFASVPEKRPRLSQAFPIRSRRNSAGARTEKDDRHQKFQDGLARVQNFLGIGDDFHARLDRAHAGSRENARARIHNAKAADTDRSLVLQMAKRGDSDAVHARGIETLVPRGRAQIGRRG